VHSLTDKERELISETQPVQLRSLDEDALAELHLRVRRARDKHVKNHRREVAQQVGATRSRAVASAPPRRSASKAEIFEAALARVSTQLAKAARLSAAELRAERLAAARNEAGTVEAARARAATAATPASATAKRTRSANRRPIERKVAASSTSAGARRQAKRDAR
jgi:hypothetical protein